MDIIVTDRAIDYLNQLNKTNAIRVRAYDTFECSTMVAYDLTFDKKREGDVHVPINDLLFIYDSKAKEEIGRFVKIDFVPSQGLKLINQNQTLAYGLRIKSND